MPPSITQDPQVEQTHDENCLTTSAACKDSLAPPIESPHWLDSAEWKYFLVSAFWCLSRHDHLAKTFRTQEDIKIALFDRLAWHDAHGQYTWPDFVTHGYNFQGSIPLRRSLVEDLYETFKKIGLLVENVDGGMVFSTGTTSGTIPPPESSKKGAGLNGTSHSHVLMASP